MNVKHMLSNICIII